MKNLRKSPLLLFALLTIFFIFVFINSSAVSAASKVNINTANATELDTIPEVGPSTAAKIIAYREANGPFVVIEDIMKVSGIKEATFVKMKDFITVSGNSSGGTDGDGDTAASTTTATSTEASDTSDNSNNSSGALSVHYIQEDLSNYTEPANIFEVSAGRDRLTYINSPVSFIAKYKIPKDLANRYCTYLWSFGDGTSKEGEKVEHIYKYAGDYNVVLNGSCSGLQAVSRTSAKVVVPNLLVAERNDGSVEISNHGEYEINLYGWRIQSSNQAYTFPMDTIISAGKSIIFSPEYLKISLAGNGVALIDASAKEVARSEVNALTANSMSTVSVTELERFTAEYKRLNRLSTYVPASANKTESNIPLTASAAGTIISTTSVDDQTEDLANSVSTEAPARGFWSKLFHPIRTIQEAFY